MDQASVTNGSAQSDGAGQLWPPDTPVGKHRSGWYWRWGVPSIAGLSALAAAAVAVDWHWGLGATASQSGDGDAPELEAIIAASALSLCLLAFWRIARRQRGAPVSVSVEAEADPLASSRRSVTRAEVVLATIVIATGVALAAYFLDLPLRNDEGLTFARLAPHPFSTVASTYGSPNNHVLHTVLVWAAHQLGGWDRVVLRLPAFFSFCLLLPALWWFARREYGPTAAAFATALAAGTPYFVEFATNGRGYTLLLLLFVAALLCGQSLVQRPGRKALWATWAATIGLGFFTMPLMAFPAATIVVWMALAHWRKRGREGLASFVAKIAVWSAAALAFAGLLYAPILVTQGIDGVRAALSGFGLAPASPGRLLWQPVVVWYRWHWMTPAWAQGILLALVFVGLAAPARTCRRRGTLLAAMVVAVAVVLVAKPFIFSSRMLVWALLAFTVLAGTGAAIVFDGLVAWAAARWPGRASPSGRLVATWAAVLLVLCVSGRWAAQPGATRMYGQDSVWARGVPVLASSVAGQSGDRSRTPGRIAAGDHFTIHNMLAIPTFLHMRSFLLVEDDAGWYYPLGRPKSRWSVHRVSGAGGKSGIKGVSGAGGESGPGGVSASGNEAKGRLFVFQGLFEQAFFGGGPANAEGTPVREFLEASGTSHELVAAFDEGSTYVLDEWTMRP